MIPTKSPSELEAMRVSGQLAATILGEVADRVAPGVTTLELSEFAGERIRALGARSAFLGYRGYPGHICVSVNEEVVHGIPGDRRIELGDIVSLDVGVEYEGFLGDNADTILVGVTDPNVVRLVSATRQALAAGIGEAVAGNRLSDVSHAVEKVVVDAGFSVVREFVGHGIGRQLHEEPQIPNFGKPGRGPILKPGMTLAIEPMVNLGGAAVEVLEDGWTVLSRDRSCSAHVEHTVAVQNGKAEILTPRDGGVTN
jgi:methionyl aminopeptidase